MSSFSLIVHRKPVAIKASKKEEPNPKGKKKAPAQKEQPVEFPLTSEGDKRLITTPCGHAFVLLAPSSEYTDHAATALLPKNAAKYELKVGDEILASCEHAHGVTALLELFRTYHGSAAVA